MGNGDKYNWMKERKQNIHKSDTARLRQDEIGEKRGTKWREV